MSRIGWERIEELEQVEREDTGIRGRLLFMRLLIVLIFGLLLYRVFWIQQNRGEELQALARDNQFATLRTDAPRGIIEDRHGRPLAVNLPSFDVTITPAFLPDDEAERQAVYARLSLLTGVPITNTVQQQALIEAANPELVSTYSRLAEIYNAPIRETLDLANVVPQLPDSIMGIVREHSFAQYVPAVIAANVTITQAYRIEEESIFLPGVRVLPTPLRDYPSAEYTSHLIGFMGPIPNENWITVLNYQRDDRVGWSGLESSMEIELSGVKGERTIEVDWTGREVRQMGLEVPPTPGLNLHLTLDLDLQRAAHKILQDFMQANREVERVDEITGERTLPEIEQAVVVAMNPQTGELLAMVNFPTFDNNRFTNEVPVDYYQGLARNEYTPLVNHAISGLYPPGSTFKLVPASGALQEGLISPNRPLQAPGSIDIPNRFAPNDPGRAQTFVCWINPGEHGLVDMFVGLSQSCDIYFYKISGGFDQDGEFVEGLSIERMGNYAQQFGFGRVQGIELFLEAAGNIPLNRDWIAQRFGRPWSTGDDYNFGIGQGFMESTPMQVAQMAAVVANGGFLYRPTLIHHMTDENGYITFVNDNSEIVLRVYQDEEGQVVYLDAEGEPVENPGILVEFDENGDYIYQPEVLNAVEVDRNNLEIVAEGLRQVNQYIDEDRFGTGATFVEWLDDFGITSAGKTGTAEYCDTIAQQKGWCTFDDIIQRRVLPTHSWYVGYAPFENPEIVVATFIYNGGEGSLWAAPVTCHVIAAYFQVGQYAPPPEIAAGETAPTPARACPGRTTAFTTAYEPPLDLLTRPDEALP